MADVQFTFVLKDDESLQRAIDNLNDAFPVGMTDDNSVYQRDVLDLFLSVAKHESLVTAEISPPYYKDN